MVVGDIVRKIGGAQQYKIQSLSEDTAVCTLYPHGSQTIKFTFKLSELEKV